MSHDREQHAADDATDARGLAASEHADQQPEQDRVDHVENDGDMDSMLTAIEKELTSLVTRCEQTTARHAEELTQRQAEIDRTLQIALKRQVEIDRQNDQLRRLADEVVQAERSLSERRNRLARRLRDRRSKMIERMTAAVDAHARRAAEELQSRAETLADREAACDQAAEQVERAMASAQTDMARARDVQALVEEQAALTADHAKSMDDLLMRREQAAHELVERLTDACALADRVRELKDQLREQRGESRELIERAERAERAKCDAESSLDAARARIAQLEDQAESLSRQKLLVEQRWLRVERELEQREATLASREQALAREAQRLSDDQAVCDSKIRELGGKLALQDRLERERWHDPRTPLPVSGLPLPAAARRRPELRLVQWKDKTS